MLSESLPHFPSLDPQRIPDKSGERAEIQAQIAEYLARGGKIQTFGVHSGEVFKRRTRKEQQAYLRRVTWRGV